MRRAKLGVPLNVVLDKELGTYSLQDQVFYQIKQLILDKRLHAGDMLPPSRLLSQQLKVSRGTISSVYKMLAQEGLVSSRIGKGTTVCQLSHQQVPEDFEIHTICAPSNNTNQTPLVADTTYFVQQKIPFALNSPDYETVPGKKWMQLVSRHSRSPWMNNGYSNPHGYEPFRRAISEFVRKRRGINCSPEQVIAVTNVQQGLSLCAQVLFNQDDVFLAENPGYDLHRDALRFFGLDVKPFPIRNELIDASQIKDLYPTAKGILITPSNQYPLCRIMDMSQRTALLDWAVRNNAWILEDDIDCEFVYKGAQIPAVAGLTKDAPVIYLGSFVNTVYPGIVVGYIIVPKALIHNFVLAKLFNDRLVSEVHAAIFTDYIEQGFFDSHLRKLNCLYQHRKQVLFEEVQNKLKEYGNLIQCNHGTHATFIFYNQINDVEFVNFLRNNYKLEARPLSATYFDGKPVSGLILGFTGFADEKIRKGITTLRNAFSFWNEHKTM